MKLRTISPEQIMTVIVAMIMFGIGIFAVFSVATGIGSTSPGPNDDSYYTYAFATNGSTAATSHVWSNNDTGGPGVSGRRYISCPGRRGNSTTNVIVEFYYKNTTQWVTAQAAGAANGTWISGNDTYRVAGGIHVTASTGRKDASWAQAWRISYDVRSPLKSGIFLGIKNSTSISNNVFNIIGIVLIVGAIMLIVGIVYSYVKPGGFGGIGGI